MRRRILLCVLSLLGTGVAWAGESASAAAGFDCAQLEQKVAQTEVDFRPPLQAEVVGKGRLYFHSAPNAACIRKVYVVPGDALTVYTPHDGWMQVMYVSRKGTETSGWVTEKRLALGEPYGQDKAIAALPKEVGAFISRRDDCEHFIGEEPYDAERRAYLEKVVRETCTGSNQQLDALRRKYRDNSEVMQALAGYEKLAE